MIASLLLRMSVVLAVIGMLLGIGMGMKQDFQLAPAHAHLNLLGFVALFLAGLYYQAVPKAADTLLAAVHTWIAVIGAVLFPIGIGAVLLGGPNYELFTIVGSLIVLIGMLLFALIVLRHGAPSKA
jgi:hypothetical protein